MTHGVRSYTFCCCLPVRFGVFMTALVGLTLGGLITISGILQITHLSADDSTATTNKIAYGIQIAVYGIYAIASFFALFGAIFRSLGIVNTFWSVLVFHFFFSLSSGIFSIVRLFQNSQDIVADCSGDLGACIKGNQIARGIIVALFILTWLMEIWGCFIVSDYCRQLEQEEEAVARKVYGPGMYAI